MPKYFSRAHKKPAQWRAVVVQVDEDSAGRGKTCRSMPVLGGGGALQYCLALEQEIVLSSGLVRLCLGSGADFEADTRSIS